MPGVYALAPLLVAILRKDFANLRLKANRLMFFGYWFGFLNETYLFLAVCVALNLRYLTFQSYGEIINSTLSIFFGLLIAGLPFFTAIFYLIPSNKIKILSKNDDFLARYGAIIQGLNFKRQDWLVIVYSVAVFVRKFWLAYMIVV